MRNHPRATPSPLALVVLTAALTWAAGAWAQEADSRQEKEGLRERPVAEPVEVGFSGPHLVVEPRVSGVATSVYVSCADGTYIHREIEGVGTALLEVVRADGTPVADGRCKYEVYVHPPVDNEAMRIAEEAGDFATIERLSRIEAEQTVIVHGVFRVASGIAIAPAEQERNR